MSEAHKLSYENYYKTPGTVTIKNLCFELEDGVDRKASRGSVTPTGVGTRFCMDGRQTREFRENPNTVKRKCGFD
jgi:hypothetical protein